MLQFRLARSGCRRRALKPLRELDYGVVTGDEEVSVSSSLSSDGRKLSSRGG